MTSWLGSNRGSKPPLLAYAFMWISDVTQVLASQSPAVYQMAPTDFWVIRYLGLGFVIPLGFICIYLLWTRPQNSLPLQFLFYGFFISGFSAVVCMGILENIRKVAEWSIGGTLFFAMLLLIFIAGYLFILF